MHCAKVSKFRKNDERGNGSSGKKASIVVVVRAAWSWQRAGGLCVVCGAGCAKTKLSSSGAHRCGRRIRRTAQNQKKS